MSQEREVTVVNQDGSSETRPLTAEDIKKQRLEKKARFARVLDRGFVNDRLVVELPPDVHGEWVPNNAMEIERKRALGFDIDTQFAKGRALHSNAEGQPVVGDCIFMTCSQEDYEIHEELKLERYVKMHGSPEEQRTQTQKEEAEFAQLMGTITETKLPVIEESDARKARKQELEEALRATAQP